MFTLDELRQRVDAYARGSVSRRDFYAWFEDNSFDAYEDSELHDACVGIDSAFSAYFFDGVEEGVLRQELVNAVRPLAHLQKIEGAEYTIVCEPDLVPGSIRLLKRPVQWETHIRATESWLPPTDVSGHRMSAIS